MKVPYDSETATIGSRCRSASKGLGSHAGVSSVPPSFSDSAPSV
jgi:hypothetical protein